jgi:hypothetical protein
LAAHCADGDPRIRSPGGCSALADRLATNNPRFSRQRFLDAAGVLYSGESEDAAIAVRLSLRASE